MTLRVIEGDGKRAEEVTEELAERVKALVYTYAGRITVAAAIGVLHIVAAELMRDAHDRET